MTKNSYVCKNGALNDTHQIQAEQFLERKMKPETEGEPVLYIALFKQSEKLGENISIY